MNPLFQMHPNKGTAAYEWTGLANHITFEPQKERIEGTSGELMTK